MMIHKCQKRCEGCPYGGPRVGGKGPLDSPLVVVAESPGKSEVRAGYPLAGMSGKVVHQFIKEDEALFLNAMECFPRPKVKNERKTKRAIGCCEQRLFSQLYAHPRRLIITMGAPALQAICRDHSLKITQLRGKLLTDSGAQAEIGVLPMLHPAALMRGMGSFRQWREDIAYAKRLLEGGPVSRFNEPKTINVDWGELGSFERFNEAIRTLEGYRLFTGDIETATLGFFEQDRRVLDIGIQAVDDPSNVVYRFDPHWLEPVHSPLIGLLEHHRYRWIWQNGKFDINYLWNVYGIQGHVDEDTILLSYARDEIPGSHDLDMIASDVLDAPDHKGMIDKYLPKKNSSYALIPDEPRIKYLGLDVAKTTQVYQALRPQIAEDKHLEKLYTQTLIPASKMLAEVERNGVWVDQEVVKKNEKEYKQRIAENEIKIQELVGREINPNSWQQVSYYLYKELKLPDKAKGSTAEDVLKNLPQVPFVKQILEHRGLVKLYGTYIKSIWGHIKEDGRVHSTYLIHGTETGRLSSRNPNMQNQPKLATIKNQFAAMPGRILLEIDLKQAELRVLAALSQDPDLCHIFATGRDLHDEVAREMFGVPPAQKPTDIQRRDAKAINFGLIYGLSDFKLALDLGITKEEAADYIQAWFDSFPKAYEFIQKCREAPARFQTIVTCFGRKKRPRLVTRENLRHLQNEACNFPEQSTASDITLHAAIRSIEPVKPSLLVNLVHDSIMLDLDDDRSEIVRCGSIIAEEMRKVPREFGLDLVTFESDAKLGTHWGSMEEIAL